MRRHCSRHAVAFLGGISLIIGWAGHVGAHATYNEIVARLTQAITEHPDDAQLHFRLAEANCEHGDWQVAFLNLDRVDELAPGEYFTDLRRAQAWLTGGKPELAKPVADRFIAAHPEIGPGWICRARAFAKLGQEKESVSDFREAMQRTPQPAPDLVQEVATALANYGENDEAAQVLAAGIEKLSPAPGLVLNAMELENRHRKFRRSADPRGRRAATGTPWMAKRASLLTHAGRSTEARAAWTALISHLAAMPNLERGSHAMSIMAEQARRALAAFDAKSNPTPGVAAPLPASASAQTASTSTPPSPTSIPTP